MPLINCPDCNKEISPHAPNCIHCGRPMSFPALSQNNPISNPPVSYKPQSEEVLSPTVLRFLGGLGLFIVIVGIFAISQQTYNTQNNLTTTQSFVDSNSTFAYSPTPARTPDPYADTSEAGIRSNIAEINKEITFEHLKKNADKYRFNAWAFKGKILQIFEENGKTGARIALDDWGNKVMWVTCDCTTNFVDDDLVFVVGYLSGTHSYTSQANWDIEIPSMIARVILSSKEAAKYLTNQKKK